MAKFISQLLITITITIEAIYFVITIRAINFVFSFIISIAMAIAMGVIDFVIFSIWPIAALLSIAI